MEPILSYPEEKPMGSPETFFLKDFEIKKKMQHLFLKMDYRFENYMKEHFRKCVFTGTVQLFFCPFVSC